MGDGSFFKGERKKVRRDVLEKRAEHMGRVVIAPKVEIIGKGKGKK